MAFPLPPAILASRDLRGAELEKSPADAWLRLYAWMQLARLGDNRILDLFRQGLIKGTVTGGQGNESLVVPLALLADKAKLTQQCNEFPAYVRHPKSDIPAMFPVEFKTIYRPR